MEKCAMCGKDVDPMEDALSAVTTPTGLWFCSMRCWGDWLRVQEKAEKRP